MTRHHNGHLLNLIYSQKKDTYPNHFWDRHSRMIMIMILFDFHEATVLFPLSIIALALGTCVIEVANLLLPLKLLTT